MQQYVSGESVAAENTLLHALRVFVVKNVYYFERDLTDLRPIMKPGIIMPVLILVFLSASGTAAPNLTKDWKPLPEDHALFIPSFSFSRAELEEMKNKAIGEAEFHFGLVRGELYAKVQSELKRMGLRNQPLPRQYDFLVRRRFAGAGKEKLK